MSAIGSDLVAAHLLEADVLRNVKARFDDRWHFDFGDGGPTVLGFDGPREPVVGKVRWSDNSLWLDGGVSTHFFGVTEDVWNFRVGGYQVCDKWLKDRRGKVLTTADLVHFHRIVIAIQETLRHRLAIDALILARGGWAQAFGLTA